jgi:hypothetical protein
MDGSAGCGLDCANGLCAGCHVLRRHVSLGRVPLRFGCSYAGESSGAKVTAVRPGVGVGLQQAGEMPIQWTGAEVL